MANTGPTPEEQMPIMPMQQRMGLGAGTTQMAPPAPRLSPQEPPGTTNMINGLGSVAHIGMAKFRDRQNGVVPKEELNKAARQYGTPRRELYGQ